MAYQRITVPEDAHSDLGGFMHNLAEQFSAAGKATVSFSADNHCEANVLCANIRGRMSQRQRDMMSSRAYQPSV